METTTLHRFRIKIVRTDGSERDGGLVDFHGEDYDAFTATEARKRILSNPSDYELDLDPAGGLFMWRGIIMPFTQLAELRVELESKAR